MGNPIKLDGKKFANPTNKRNISNKQANEIKRQNIQDSRYKNANRANLRKMKGRKKKK